MISSISYTENIDPALLQSSNSASTSPSAMYPPINVSNIEPAPPNTNAAPPTASLSCTATAVPPSSRTSAPTTFSLPCINGAEPRNMCYGGQEGETVVQGPSTDLQAVRDQ
ncbi:hypothetical protein BDD12DRAFT_899903 [Trichophaea hybrida]|nr:hypothetical protein BDD12DRAFT_899903 [Trichophaea hybrida]